MRRWADSWPATFARDHELYAEFALAERLGMTVRDLRRRMPQHEFAEWQAFLRIRYERERRASRGRGATLG